MSAKDILTVAASQIGYLEKRSNSQLDDFTANAGSANYNKYARDIWPSLQAQPWCDIFVSWCAVQAGESEAVGKFAKEEPDMATPDEPLIRAETYLAGALGEAVTLPEPLTREDVYGWELT